MPRRDKWRKHRRHHAKVRAAERYNLALTKQDLVNIVGMIKSRKVISSRRLSNSKSVKLIDYQQQRLVVIYSHRHQEIITFLPEDSRQGRLLVIEGR